MNTPHQRERIPCGKRLLAVILTITLLFTTVIPVFAETQTVTGDISAGVSEEAVMENSLPDNTAGTDIDATQQEVLPENETTTVEPTETEITSEESAAGTATVIDEADVSTAETTDDTASQEEQAEYAAQDEAENTEDAENAENADNTATSMPEETAAQTVTNEEQEQGVDDIPEIEAELVIDEDDTAYLKQTGELALGADTQVVRGTNGMPALNIVLSNTTLNQIKSNPKDTKYAGNTVNMTVNGSVSTYANVEIKGRGNSTWSRPKKPFQIKFDKKQNLFNQGKAKKWILLANDLDISQIRNAAGLTIASKAGIPAALPPGQYVEVYFNGVYEGLYYLTRKVEVGTVPLKDDKGIIVEFEHIRTPDEPYGVSVGGSRFGTKETVIDSDIMAEQKAVFDNFMTSYNKFEKAVMNKDFAEASKYADMESFAKHFILSDFSGGQDMFGSSCYMYKDGDNDVIHAGPMWDFDLAYAGLSLKITNESANPYRTWAYMDVRECPDSKEYSKKWTPLYEYLMNMPEFRRLVRDTYRNTVRGALVDTCSEMNSLSSSISAARTKDLAKWHPNRSGNEEAAKAITYMNNRIDYFDFLYGDEETLDGIYSMKGAYKTENIRAIKAGDGYYVLLNRAGSALDVAGAKKNDGAAVQWYPYNGSDAQKWMPLKNGVLVSKETGFVLTQQSGGGLYISKVRLSKGKPSGEQTFRFSKATMDIASILKAKPYIVTDADNAASQNIKEKDYGKTLKEGVDYTVKAVAGNRSITYTFTGIGAYAGTTTVTVRTAYNNGFDKNVFYRISTKLNRNKVVTVRDGSLSSSGNIQLETFSGKLEDLWYFDKQNDGTYVIRNARSGMAVDVTGGMTANGTNIQQYAPNGTPAQKFIIDQRSAGAYEIISFGSQKAMDVTGAKTSDGTNIQIYTPNNTGAQRWYIEAVGKRPELSGTYKIVSNVGKADKGISVEGTSYANKANIILWHAATSASAAWTVSKNDDINRTWSIKSAYSGLALDVTGAGTKNCTNVQQYAFGKNNTAQKWVLMENMNGGQCTIFSICSGMALDVSGGADKNRANVQIYTPNGTNAQKWTFQKIA